jgi:hypothetical protein
VPNIADNIGHKKQNDDNIGHKKQNEDNIGHKTQNEDNIGHKKQNEDNTGHKTQNDKNTASNYRPVSLTYILCKTLEHIVNSSIMKHLNIQQILSDSQHGFRARRSCETQLLETVDDTTKRVSRLCRSGIIVDPRLHP